MRARPVAVVAVLLLSSPGCGGGGGGGLVPPSDLRIEQGEPFDWVRVTWIEPSGSVDGYEIAGRIGSGAWEQYSDLIPAPAYGVDAELQPSTPELVTLGVRVRSARGSARSDWSPEATMLRTVRPPSGLAGTPASSPNGAHVPPVHLTWSNDSLVATSAELQRGPGYDPAEGSFVPVTSLAATATAHDDADPSEGMWTYRIRAGAGGTWGPWARGWLSRAIDVVPPRDLVVVREAGGVRLTWSNRSALAEQAVTRLEPAGFSDLLATLPVGADEYLDDQMTAPWPATRYRVTASIPGPGGAVASSPEVTVGPFTMDGPVPFAGSARYAPGAIHLALTDLGLLHAATWNGPLAIERDTGSGWKRHDLAGAQSMAMPAVLADQEGNPHTVVYRGYPDDPSTALVHEWYDGAAWREETVTMAPADGATFALGSGGALHVLAQRREVSGFYTTVHHVAASGSVTSTDILPTVLPPPTGAAPYYEFGHSMSVAADGTAWLAMTYAAPPLAQTTFVLVRRTATGAWSQELVPPSTTIAAATVAGGSADAAAILHDGQARLRSASGWGADEAVPLTGMSMLGAALALDGVRLHVLLSSYPGGLWLSARGPGGWEAMQLGTPAPYWARTGFTADGRATVVVPHGPDALARAWVSLLVQPP